MNKILIGIALASVSIGATAPAAGMVNVRQANQERRIDAGVRSGKLTGAEATRLRNDQHAISRLEDRMRLRNGGRLTAADKRAIDARQEAADRAILAQKGDGQRGKNHLPL
jgi:hypothetical protein